MVIKAMAGVGVMPSTRSRSKAAVKNEETVVLSCPPPPPYKEIHREAMMSLNPQVYCFEGLRFSFTKEVFKLNCQNLFPHSATIPFIKGVSTANYAPNCLLAGSVMTNGKFNARVKFDFSDNIIFNANAELMNKLHMSHAMVNLEYKGSDYRYQIHMGHGALIGANLIQSMTPHFSFGGEVFWDGEHQGVSYGARFNTEKMVATGQVASTGMLALNYVQKVSEEVILASNCTFDCLSKDVTASVGYDWVFGQRRMRGMINTNGSRAVSMEQRSSMGHKLVLSGQIDEKKKFKFGVGLSV